MAKKYPQDLSDQQKEILLRTMKDEVEMNNWCNHLVERMKQESLDRGVDLDAVAIIDEKISIIASDNRIKPHPYDELRRRAYPDIGDQLDDLYHKGAFSDEMTAKLKAVKDANPKG